MAVESWGTFHNSRVLYAHIRDNRFENNAKFVYHARACPSRELGKKFVKTSKL